MLEADYPQHFHFRFWPNDMADELFQHAPTENSSEMKWKNLHNCINNVHS